MLLTGILKVLQNLDEQETRIYELYPTSLLSIDSTTHNQLENIKIQQKYYLTLASNALGLKVEQSDE